MKRVGVVAAAAAVAFSLSSAPASANLIFDLSNANMVFIGTATFAGQATGSITLDDALTTVIAANINVPSAVNGSFVFSAFNYTVPGGTVSELLPFTFIRIDQDVNPTLKQLQFSFGTFTVAGVSLITNGTSYENQQQAGTRIFSSGAFIPHVEAAVPEPATWMVMLSALGLFGLGWLRRGQAGASV